MTGSFFISENFLLQSPASQKLFHTYAKDLPVFDYHNHLSPKDIAENRKFNNLSEIWLEGDHYKWRAMRANGIEEAFITGNKSAKEKFIKWAATVPHTMRNPLFHWTHLELKNYFGIEELLNEKSAERIYENANAQLQQNEFSVLGLLKNMNVDTVCTTDDPIDTLAFHQQHAKSGSPIKMYPAFRPDRAYQFENQAECNQYLDKLSEVSGTEINDLKTLIDALSKRVDYFHANGCRISDHGLEQMPDGTASEGELKNIFSSFRAGKSITRSECDLLRRFVLLRLCELYHKKGWVQQFHLGPIRNNTTRIMQQVGVDAGVDSIGDFEQARSLSSFLDELDRENRLAKTILYNLNPRDNELFVTMAGNFNDGSVPGKMQWGAAWWYLDQKDGIEKQINALSNMGLLSRFVGMVTDSRSFLSFPRHEYFRRILCNLIGNDITNGELPEDYDAIGDMVRNCCYYNAKNYFSMPVQN